VTALDPRVIPSASPLLSAALDYLARGWFVLPCRVGTKQNAAGVTVKDVRPIDHWDQASTNDPATVAAWFGPGGTWADGSLAIDTGKSGLVVVDLDTSGDKNGLQAWSELGGGVASLVHKTPSHGVHLFFRADPARPVGIDSRGKLAYGVDVRGIGGLVIAPPSKDWRGAYEVTAAGDWSNLTPVPDIVTERVPLGGSGAPPPSVPVARPGGHQRDPSGLGHLVTGDGIPKYTKDSANKRIQEVLGRAMATPEGSGFNHALNEAAYELGHWVAGGHITHADAESLLSYVVTAQFPHGPNGDDLATIDSGLGGGMAKPYLVLPDAVAGMVPVATADGTPDDDAFEMEVQKQYYRLKALEQARERVAAEKVIGEGDGKFDWSLLDKPPKPVEWLVPDVLAAGRSYSLVGGPKAGKSYAARDFAVQAAEAGHSVIYLDRENTAEGDWAPHLRAMGVRPELRKLLDIRNFPAIPPLDTEAGGSMLVEWVKESGARVVFIDMLMRFLSGKENDSDTFNAYDRYTGQKLKAMGVAVVRLDHSGHDETGRARGSSAKAGDVDVQWMLTRDEGLVTLDPRGISRHADQRDPIKLLPQGSPGRLRKAEGTPLEREAGADAVLVTALQEMLDSGDLTTKASEKVAQLRLRARGHKGRNEKMNKAWMETLRRNGVAGMPPEQKPKRSGFTPTFLTQGVDDVNGPSRAGPGDHKINNSVGDRIGDQSPGSGTAGTRDSEMGPGQG
jgi:hypothetical protein